MLTVNTDSFEAAKQAIQKATIEFPEDTTLDPARFVLQLKSEKDGDQAVSLIEKELSEFDARVTLFPGDDPLLMLLTLHGCLSRNDYPLSFEAGYQLIDAFGLRNIEPEVFTDIYAEPKSSGFNKGREGVGNFPPGCWTREDERLKERKRWAISDMEVEAAWLLSPEGQKQGEGIVIAQIDTGITAHPELANVTYHENPIDLLRDIVGANDPLGYFFGNPGHGTSTASVIVSSEVGDILGTAPKAVHMPIRAIRSVIRLSQMRVAEGIHYAIDHGAHVITMSLGGTFSISLEDAIRRAVRENIIVLAAAGNCVDEVVYPARYDSCLAIGGSNYDRAPWKGSSRGSAVVVSAPAENVYRADVELEDGEPGFSIGQGDGTSYAVALTAGVAACWLAHHRRDRLISEARQRGETLNEMFRRLVRATASRPNGWNTFRFGAGIVNARKLLHSSLDNGLGEAAHSFGNEGMPGDTLPAFVFEMTGSLEVLREPIDWEIYGAEIVLAMLRRAKGSEPTGRGRETTKGLQSETEQPPLSATLGSVVAKSQTLRRGLGR